MSSVISSDTDQQNRQTINRLLSIGEVALRLGVSTFTIRRLIRARALKSVRISRRVMVPESAIQLAIEHGCRR
jgi:excisionase family DNA binding protein